MKKLSILCEGPDNTGKSTQIRNIIDHFVNVQFIPGHFSNVRSLNTPESVIGYSIELYNNMFNATKHNSFIFDRAHLGEYVYGKIYRDYNADYIFSLEHKHKCSTRDDICLILFIDTPENLIARDDGLSFSIDPGVKKYEIERFVEAFNRSEIKHKILIDINGLSEEGVFKKVKEFLEGIPNAE